MNCCSTSFCFYITVATVLNLPPIVVGLTDLPNAVSGCSGSIWLLVFWLLCLVNIVAAFYMSVAVQRDDSIVPHRNQDGSAPTTQQTAADGMSRVKHLFCYDVWMAVYILVLMGFFGWLLLGGAWFASGTMDDSDECDGIHGKVGIAYGFGWAFVFLGGCALTGSLCCSMFEPARPPSNYSVPANATGTTAAPANSAPIPEKTPAPASNGDNTAPSAKATASAPPEPPMAQAMPIPDNYKANDVETGFEVQTGLK
jgi:hypothetical protein